MRIGRRPEGPVSPGGTALSRLTMRRATPDTMSPIDRGLLASTRRTLHGVAELLIAGPQYRVHGTIRLHVTPGGFGGVVSDVRVDGTDLVSGGRRQPIAGTARRLAAALGVDVGKPEGVYGDTSGVGEDEPLVVDDAAVAAIASWFATGDAALRTAFDGVQPILWPEHFDLGVTVDEVTFGVSPGDAWVPEPYAYVAPFQRRAGAFWNAPFGASRPAADLDGVEAVAGFFHAGRNAG
jgi:hypothetical protein